MQNVKPNVTINTKSNNLSIVPKSICFKQIKSICINFLFDLINQSETKTQQRQLR